MGEQIRMDNFNQICFNFQKNIINTFNQQNNIPFLLKYYLLKDIWDGIEKYRIELDMQAQQQDRKVSLPGFQNKTLAQFQEKNQDKQNLTN